MRPYTVCYMMSSIDGRIDCAMTEYLPGTDLYYDILKDYAFDACISGKITASMHYAEGVMPSCGKKISKPEFYKAEDAKYYTVIADTKGTLKWNSNSIDGTHLVVALSEDVTEEYLSYLRNMKISFIAKGKESIDLAYALEILGTEFGVKRCGVVGGGLINGSFLSKGLLDEVGILIGPGIDGREDFRASFDGLHHGDIPYVLHLESCKVYPCEAVFLKYTVKK